MVNINSNLSEQTIETIIDSAISELINYVQSFEEKLGLIETKLKSKEEYIEQISRKYEHQIQKLSKSLKDKESHFNKQRESLVSYYEQLLNDVNARVKVS